VCDAVCLCPIQVQIVYQDKVVEKIVEVPVEKIVTKEVIKEVPVEKIVYVEKQSEVMGDDYGSSQQQTNSLGSSINDQCNQQSSTSVSAAAAGAGAAAQSETVSASTAHEYRSLLPSTVYETQEREEPVRLEPYQQEYQPEIQMPPLFVYQQQQQQQQHQQHHPHQQPQPHPGGGGICGVGMLLGRFEGSAEKLAGNLYVLQLVPGGPAHHCGQIHVDDVLYKVDNVSVKGWSLDEVSEVMKGQEGTPVSLEFGRAKDNGKMAKFKLTLFRGHVADRSSGGYSSGGGGWPEQGSGSQARAAPREGGGFVHSTVPFGSNGVQVTHLPAAPRQYVKTGTVHGSGGARGMAGISLEEWQQRGT